MIDWLTSDSAVLVTYFLLVLAGVLWIAGEVAMVWQERRRPPQ